MSKNDRKLIIGGRVGIKMSWVEKNRKISNLGGGDDYLGLESSCFLLYFFGVGTKLNCCLKVQRYVKRMNDLINF